MIASVKKRKMNKLNTLKKENLEKIAKIEGVPIEGSKDELVARLATKLNLAKTRDYVKKLSVSEAFDIFKHKLVPKHRVISEEEKKDLFEKYHITERHLPRISVTDPAILVIGAKVRDVVEITRKSPVAGETKYYRVVVKPKKKR